MPVWNFVRRSYYQDSVTLMRLTRDLEAVAGVRRAAVMMGTEPNRALLQQAGLLAAEGERAAPADLLIAVDADDLVAAEAARDAAETALGAARAASAPRTGPRPRTLRSALTVLPEATLALVSVPGVYAGAEAQRALDAGLHVMLFSDNVPVATEIALKRAAAARGLFVLGPDCGTAILHGVPLGFANAVPRGRVGLVAASGTGLQEVTCRLAAEGEGVSHAIGVGSRDLSDAVGGAMTLPALAALRDDTATEVVVVIGKPPGPAVVPALVGALQGLGKPAVLALMGRAAFPTLRGVHVVTTLDDAAVAAAQLATGREPRAVAVPDLDAIAAREAGALVPGQRYVRGVYSGGTLAWEALALLSERLADVAPGVLGEGTGHRVVDLGEDVFTVGRPHPMIDGGVRRDWIAREAADPTTAVLLLDLVLGYGAHLDPAGELRPALEAARRTARAAGRGLAMVASVTGTEADPQRRSAQVAALERAGAVVAGSNAQAARLAARIAARVA